MATGGAGEDRPSAAATEAGKDTIGDNLEQMLNNPDLDEVKTQDMANILSEGLAHIDIKTVDDLLKGVLNQEPAGAAGATSAAPQPPPFSQLPQPLPSPTLGAALPGLPMQVPPQPDGGHPQMPSQGLPMPGQGPVGLPGPPQGQSPQQQLGQQRTPGSLSPISMPLPSPYANPQTQDYPR